MAEQRRGKRIAMSAEEVDAYLGAQRTCRVASLGKDGAPHVSPLWFVWDGTSMWLNSIVASQRWVNMLRDSRVGVAVDDGHEFLELRGVEMSGEVEMVGEAPRGSDPDPAVEQPERLWSEKYMGGQPYRSDGRHAWVAPHTTNGAQLGLHQDRTVAR